MRTSALVACAALTLTLRPSGVAVQPQNDRRIAEALEPIRVKHHLPALGGAIVTSHGLVALAVTGVRKAGTDVAVTPADLWHLGSDTKAMTAAWIARAVAGSAGRLTWESTIGSVLTQETAGAPEAFRNITLTQLLCHRAGLPPNVNWQQAARAAAAPRAQRLEAVRMAAATSLLSVPGSKYEYSNLGFVLAAAMAEKVTDAAWEDAIQTSIFTPLGMSSAGFGGLGTPGTIDQPWPHTGNGQPTAMNGPLVDNAEVMGPAGTVHCSLADWAKFIADQLDGLQGRGKLFPPATYTQLHTPPFGGDYAFGWLAAERAWAGGTAYTHAGSNTMNFAVVWMAPKRDFAVLVTTNQGGTGVPLAADEAASALILLHGSGK
jgi:CubicO group peptidase (beta-lactamase class C family)